MSVLFLTTYAGYSQFLLPEIIMYLKLLPPCFTDLPSSVVLPSGYHQVLAATGGAVVQAIGLHPCFCGQTRCTCTEAVGEGQPPWGQVGTGSTPRLSPFQGGGPPILVGAGIGVGALTLGTQG